MILRQYLAKQYQADGITDGEITKIVQQLQSLPASDLYQSNKTFCHWLSNGFYSSVKIANQKDLYIELIDTQTLPDQLVKLFAGSRAIRSR